MPASFAENGPVISQCLLCPHDCKLEEGQIGLCAVRRRSNGRIETAAFSTVAKHWSPIERKPLYHYRPGMQVLTLAPPGCTMGCLYCQNYRASQIGRSDLAVPNAAAVNVSEVMSEADAKGGAVALSYTEPALGAELTLALSGAGNAPLIWKSNGFLTRTAISAIAPVLSAANIDLKSGDERAHQRLTGAALRPVLETISAFRAAGVWIEISTPLISGFNDDPRSIAAMANIITQIDPNIPWHLLRVTPEFRLRAIMPTLPETLQAARNLGKASGLRYIYVERALGPEGRETRCFACGVQLIHRDIWRTTSVDIRDGHCRHCHVAVPGIWSHSKELDRVNV